MKTETQVAVENIEWFIRNDKDHIMRGMCEKHKASCKRFLDWMSQYEVPEATHDERVEKITDLHNAIKKYGDAGI